MEKWNGGLMGWRKNSEENAFCVAERRDSQE